VPPKPALDVYCAEQRTGVLARSDVHEGDFLFGYVADCPTKNAVSLTMPVVRDQYDSMNTVHPIFEMNLPEGALLEKLRLRFAKAIPNFDDLALLEIVGQSQIGRLRYARAGTNLAEPATESLHKLLTYKGAEELFARLLEQYASHSGVSGIQPKVLIRAEESNLDRITHRSTTHIVKSFDPNEFAELAANEYFCTRAAIHAGLPTARPRLSDNRRLLVAERFDLRKDGSYLGVEDFCVLNALRSHGRYDGSYELIARRIRQFVSPEEVAPALEQLFLTVALCSAIENGDAHLKNFAIVYENAGSTVRLAPAYDLVCTTVYVSDDSMALTLDGSKAFPTVKELESFARLHCDLRPAHAKKALQHVVAGVTRSAQEIREYANRHADFENAAGRLIARFNHGLRRIGINEC
jgi:serine/threonine-protein kinase HipA